MPGIDHDDPVLPGNLDLLTRLTLLSGDLRQNDIDDDPVGLILKFLQLEHRRLYLTGKRELDAHPGIGTRGNGYPLHPRFVQRR